jgi:CDP-diacylglycerol--glycerol-3-phosphate 3-phosphatidyltransferase
MEIVPNCISILRIVLSLALLFIKPLSAAFFAIYFICGFSDMLDGFIARKFGVSGKLGEKLDTLADMVMICILFIVLIPIIVLSIQISVWIVLIAIIRFSSIIVALKKYKEFIGIHTYGNKITGMVLFILPILLLYINTTALIYSVCIIASISAIEELAIHLTSSKPDANRKSIFTK